MRRRYEDGELPPALRVFDGRPYRTEAEWTAAFDDWNEARERWRTARDMPVTALPPTEINGECPFDPSTI